MIIGSTPSVDVDIRIIIGSGHSFCLNDSFFLFILVVAVLMLFDDSNRLNVMFR